MISAAWCQLIVMYMDSPAGRSIALLSTFYKGYAWPCCLILPAFALQEGAMDSFALAAGVRCGTHVAARVLSSGATHHPAWGAGAGLLPDVFTCPAGTVNNGDDDVDSDGSDGELSWQDEDEDSDSDDDFDSGSWEEGDEDDDSWDEHQDEDEDSDSSDNEGDDEDWWWLTHHHAAPRALLHLLPAHLPASSSPLNTPSHRLSQASRRLVQHSSVTYSHSSPDPSTGSFFTPRVFPVKSLCCMDPLPPPPSSPAYVITISLRPAVGVQGGKEGQESHQTCAALLQPLFEQVVMSGVAGKLLPTPFDAASLVCDPHTTAAVITLSEEGAVHQVMAHLSGGGMGAVVEGAATSCGTAISAETELRGHGPLTPARLLFSCDANNANSQVDDVAHVSIPQLCCPKPALPPPPPPPQPAAVVCRKPAAYWQWVAKSFNLDDEFVCVSSGGVWQQYACGCDCCAPPTSQPGSSPGGSRRLLGPHVRVRV